MSKQKKQYDAKALFIQGLIAFGRFFSGKSDAAKEQVFETKNPAGSKLLRRWYKQATGLRGDYQTAKRWRDELQ